MIRIWDIDPGYLNNRDLRNEHHDLHKIVAALANKHRRRTWPAEFKRWHTCGWALRLRHQLLISEMTLRGFADATPVRLRANKGVWPSTYIVPPGRQFRLLRENYYEQEPGRIELPKNTQQLWSQHKYSVLARQVNLYEQLGRAVSGKLLSFNTLALLLTELLRKQPTEGGIRNALQHMWGYVSDTLVDNSVMPRWPLHRLVLETQRRAMETGVSYICSSTALSELKVWLTRV